jgi:hypothetical protein
MAEEHKHFGQRIGPFTAGTSSSVLNATVLRRCVAVLVSSISLECFTNKPRTHVSQICLACHVYPAVQYTHFDT